MNPSDPSFFLLAVHGVRNVFSGEWMLAIAVVLLNGPMHYKDILSAERALDAVDWSEISGPARECSDENIARTTTDELLIREEEAGILPPSVRYALCPETRDALEAAVPLAAWAVTHQELIGTARRSAVSDNARTAAVEPYIHSKNRQHVANLRPAETSKASAGRRVGHLACGVDRSALSGDRA